MLKYEQSPGGHYPSRCTWVYNEANRFVTESQDKSYADLLVNKLSSALGETPCANDILLVSDRAVLSIRDERPDMDVQLEPEQLICSSPSSYRNVTLEFYDCWTYDKDVHDSFHAWFTTIQYFASFGLLCSLCCERWRSTTTEVLFLIHVMEA